MTIPGDIVDRAYKGTATKEDAFALLDVNPFELYTLADDLRKEAVGDTVTYVTNRNIYITNMCKGSCGFCAFREGEGYILTIEEILAQVGEAEKAGAVEICIQGGYLPQLDLEFYNEIVRSIKTNYPNMTIHGFSPMEIHYASSLSGTPLEEAFSELKKNGLGTLTGTSAEILSDRVRKIICEDKITTGQWVETIKASHKTGLRTNATIMYGHVETWEERFDHILTIRDIQKETGAFTELITMPFMPYNNRIGEEMLRSGKFMTTGTEDLQLIAIARVLLNKHIDNLQACWVKLGKKLAQVALSCGANDMGGTLMEDQITLASGGSNGEYLPPEELEWTIRSAGRIPMRRNALYEEM
ncbi:5-amino-6-(D-ribitylamino)uracil--L-tyrosine 4-hydroxyphenyl transferase CofH [Methanococcoides sp. FTZ1]|uniref:5-amino-6-(D-ribitylamino)uracil--L-tyrosine 4-hydroxyphenyl transferase CofH n=1 Tax=Methanococcoides sp. FTZ1 TaxID=3439061 RepID=UPI003F84B658